MGLSLRGWSVEQVLDGGLFCLGLIQAPSHHSFTFNF